MSFGLLPDDLRPEITETDALALRLYNLMGGLDWAALPVVFTWYGIDDADTMIERLLIIKRNS